MATQAGAGSIGIRQAIRQGTDTPDLRPSGLLFFVLSSAFLIVTMLAASIAPAYDFHGGAISDLGVIDETALLFNGLLVFIGACNVAAGYLLYRGHRQRWLLAIYAGAGIGAAGAGLVTLDVGGLHSIFAAMAFLLLNIEVLATAVRLRSPMRELGVGAGAVGLVFLVLMIVGDAGNPAVFGSYGHGGSERMIAYPAMVWLLALGGYLMARPTDLLDRPRDVPAR
jgi:hypothetical membrane protein